MSLRWARIDDVAKRRSDSVAVDPGETYPMLGVLNKGRGLFDRETMNGSDTSYSRLTKLRIGDLVYSKLFGWEGSVAIVDRAGYVSHEFPTYELDADQIDQNYLRHAIQWEPFVRQLSDGTTGMGQRRQRVQPQRFEAVRFPLPELPEQGRVAARLDAVASASREKTNQPRPQRSIFRHRILSDMTRTSLPTPAGKVLRRRLDAVDVLADRTYPILGMRNQGRGPFAAGELKGNSTSYKRLFRAHAGDLVYLKLGAWERAFGIVPPELDGRYASGEFVMYELRDSLIDRDFLSQLIRWEELIGGIGGKSTGTNVRRRRLRPETFEAAHLPLPSLPEQRRVGALLGQLDEVERLRAHRATLAAALLPAARNEEFGRLLSDAPAQ